MSRNYISCFRDFAYQFESLLDACRDIFSKTHTMANGDQVPKSYGFWCNSDGF